MSRSLDRLVELQLGGSILELCKKTVRIEELEKELKELQLKLKSKSEAEKKPEKE